MSQEPIAGDFNPGFESAPENQTLEETEASPITVSDEAQNLAGLPRVIYEALPKDLRDHIEASGEEKALHTHFLDWLVATGLYDKVFYGFQERYGIDADAASNAFFRCVEKILKRLLLGAVSDGNFAGFITTSANNQKLDDYKHANVRRHKRLSNDCPERPRPPTGSHLEREELARKVESELAALACLDQKIILLRIYRKLKFREIDEELNLVKGAARRKFEKACERFKKRYGPCDF